MSAPFPTNAGRHDPIAIDVVSDVVCPWCFLGKRRLTAAEALLPNVATTVRWRPFRLDPTIPPEGISRTDYIRGKFGGPEALEPAHRQLEAMGRAVGIDFRFDRITRSPSSVDAHRLIRWAEPAGLQDAIVERLFRAYFTDGEDVGDRATLTRIAGEAGMDAEAVARRLASNEDRAAIDHEVNEAYRLGINGVPCFIVGRRYAIMGAQPAETITEVIGKVAEEEADAASLM